MIVFDLKCAGAGHVFEGWFGSSADFDQQRIAGLLSCPVCGDASIEKAVMAPAVGAKSNQKGGPSLPVVANEEDRGAVAGKPIPMHSGMDSQKAMQLMHALAQAQAEALAESEWVGRRFADEARAMHYGEEDHRPIHGEVDIGEARDLIEEGVEVAPLLFPVIPPGAQN